MCSDAHSITLKKHTVLSEVWRPKNIYITYYNVYYNTDL